MENLNLLLNRLLDSKLDFVLIGGYAAVVHGSSLVTHDLDICAIITEENLKLLKQILNDLEPKHRMNPNFQPSLDDYPPSGQTIENLYLRTNIGILDIVKNVPPVGGFEDIKKRANTISIFGHNCKVISLNDLILIKRSMTRTKDLVVLSELEAIKEKYTTTTKK